MAKKHRLEILAVLKDELSASLKKINKALDLTDKATKDLSRSSKSAASNTRKLSRESKSAAKSVSSLYQSIKRLSRGLSNVKFLAGAAMAALGVYAIARVGRAIGSVTVEVEKLSAEIGTLVGGRTKENLSDLSQAIRHMAVMGGQTLKDEFSAAYDAISAGIPKESLIEFLGATNKLAVGGVTDVATATDLLTTVVNSFNIEVENIDGVLDSLFQTVKFGKLRMADLANSIGRVAPVAEKAGLSLDEMNAAIATLTISGLKTEEATTALRQLLSTLIDLPPVAKKKLAEMGLEDVFSLESMREKGFSRFIVDLAKAVRGREEELAGFIGNIRALTGALSLVNEEGETLVKIMNGFADAEGAADRAAALVTNTLGHQLSRLRALKEAFMVDLGNELFAGLTSRVKAFVDAVEQARIAIFNIRKELTLETLLIEQGEGSEERKEQLEAKLQELVGALRSTIQTTVLASAEIIGVVFLSVFEFLAREFGSMLYNSITAAILRWASNNPTLASAIGLESAYGTYARDPGVRREQFRMELRDTQALEGAISKSRYFGTDILGEELPRQLTKIAEQFRSEIGDEKLSLILSIAARDGLMAGWEQFTKTAEITDVAGGAVFGGMTPGEAFRGGDPQQAVYLAYVQLLSTAAEKAKQLQRNLSDIDKEIAQLNRSSGQGLMSLVESLGGRLESVFGRRGQDIKSTIDNLVSVMSPMRDFVGITRTGLQDAANETTIFGNAVGWLSSQFDKAKGSVTGAFDTIRFEFGRAQEMMQDHEINILKALGLKDVAEIMEIRIEIERLRKQLEGTAYGTADRLQISNAIIVKEVELARLEIQHAMNNAMKDYRDAVKAANDARKAGQAGFSAGDYSNAMNKAVEDYNNALEDQLAILDALKAEYPQFTEYINQFADSLDRVTSTSETLKFKFGEASDAAQGFVAGLGVSSNMLEAIGQTIGSRLGGAIDGLISGTKTLGQAFREMAIGMIQDIAKIIVKMMILMALQAVTGVPLGGASSFFNRGGFVRRNSGGIIPGFSSGGYLARYGPDRDSVPAMLTPGEFVIRRSAVDHYGTSLLSAINSMVAPKNLSGFANSASRSSGGVQHLNVGGQVKDSKQSSVPQPAYVVANERSMQSLLTGGRNAMIEFLRQNKESYSSDHRGGAR